MFKKNVFFVLFFLIFINSCFQNNNFYNRKYNLDCFLIKKNIDKIDKNIISDKKIFINYFEIEGYDPEQLMALKKRFIVILSNEYDISNNKKDAELFINIFVNNFNLNINSNCEEKNVLLKKKKTAILKNEDNIESQKILISVKDVYSNELIYISETVGINIYIFKILVKKN